MLDPSRLPVGMPLYVRFDHERDDRSDRAQRHPEVVEDVMRDDRGWIDPFGVETIAVGAPESSGRVLGHPMDRPDLDRDDRTERRAPHERRPSARATDGPGRRVANDERPVNAHDTSPSVDLNAGSMTAWWATPNVGNGTSRSSSSSISRSTSRSNLTRPTLDATHRFTRRSARAASPTVSRATATRCPERSDSRIRAWSRWPLRPTTQSK